MDVGLTICMKVENDFEEENQGEIFLGEFLSKFTRQNALLILIALQSFTRVGYSYIDVKKKSRATIIYNYIILD